MAQLSFSNGRVTDASAVCEQCDTKPFPDSYDYCPYCGVKL